VVGARADPKGFGARRRRVGLIVRVCRARWSRVGARTRYSAGRSGSGTTH
jgi:hypothetical protein